MKDWTSEVIKRFMTGETIMKVNHHTIYNIYGFHLLDDVARLHVRKVVSRGGRYWLLNNEYSTPHLVGAIFKENVAVSMEKPNGKVEILQE